MDTVWTLFIRLFMDVLEDVQKEYEKEIEKLKKTIAELLDIIVSLKNRNAELDGKIWNDYVTDIDYNGFMINLAEYGLITHLAGTFWALYEWHFITILSQL